jgi:hypothetical protein
MLKTITDILFWTNNNTQDEWKSWEEWQNKQDKKHFEKSELFQYYLSCRPYYQIPKNSFITDLNNSKYYSYCFGDFVGLIVNPDGCNAIKYISLLLDVYDVCKGFTRRVKGDPEGITLLREVITKNNLAILDKHNFTQYLYPYTNIHAHTVTQFSLSTFLLRILLHYMSFIKINIYDSSISLSLCKKTYDNKYFGNNFNNVSNNIHIINKNTKNSDTRSFSWPRDTSGSLRCRSCCRITENTWGDFDACLDCHLRRICSVCGQKAIIIIDDLPKCYNHQ